MPIGMNKVSRSSKKPSVIPDSVVHQYPIGNFSSQTWADAVAGADMSVNGLTASTFDDGSESVFGDGSNDYGTSDGPQNLPKESTHGVAFTTELTSPGDFDYHFGIEDGTHKFIFGYIDFFAPLGQPSYQIVDGDGNRNAVYLDNPIDDGTKKTIVVNKTGLNASDVDVYVNDMTTPASSTVIEEDTLNPSSFNPTSEMGFFASYDGSSPQGFLNSKHSIFEFNTEPYSESQRLDFEQRV